MATNLPRVTLFADACEYFTNEILPMVREHYEKDGQPDWPARGESWCNWTDALCKDGETSDWQYANWSHPPCNG